MKADAAISETPVVRAPHNSLKSRLPLLVCVALGIATFIFYSPVRSFDFVRFDDPQYILENDFVRKGLSIGGLVAAFRETLADNWHPLTCLSHMLDCQLFGVNASRHHLINVFFHALNTMLLFVFLRKIKAALWPSAFVAALFAFHPLHVESVAWISERKDVLSGFFWFLSLWFYVQFVERSQLRHARSKISYGMALLFFACGLLSKPMVVTLPFVFLLLDLWPLNRMSSPGTSPRRLVLEKVPFFALAALLSVITFFAQRNALAGAQMPITWRLGNALISYERYLQKMFWPTNLTFLYPHPGKWPMELIVISALVLMAISILFVWQRRERPYLIFGWLWFLGTLVPVIGLVQVGLQSMADRYTYLPLVGLLIALVWGINEIAKKIRLPAAILAGGALVLVFATAAVARNQLNTWKDSFALYHHALGIWSQDKVYRMAMQNPIYLNFHLRLCEDLAGSDSAKAESYLREVAALAPQNAEVHLALGNVLASQNQLSAAVDEFHMAAQLDSNNAQAHFHLGRIAALQNRMDQAEAEFAKAVALQPNDAEFHFTLGLLFEGTRRRREAIAEFREALRCQPDFADAQKELEALGTR